MVSRAPGCLNRGESREFCFTSTSGRLRKRAQTGPLFGFGPVAVGFAPFVTTPAAAANLSAESPKANFISTICARRGGNRLTTETERPGGFGYR